MVVVVVVVVVVSLLIAVSCRVWDGAWGIDSAGRVAVRDVVSRVGWGMGDRFGRPG